MNMTLPTSHPMSYSLAHKWCSANIIAFRSEGKMNYRIVMGSDQGGAHQAGPEGTAPPLAAPTGGGRPGEAPLGG